MPQSSGLNPVKVKAAPGILRTAKPKPSKPSLAAKPRMRKCAICKTPFRPANVMRDKWCSVECGAELGIRLAVQRKDKVERKDIAARKLAIKPRSKWLAEAQKVFNAYIRARDADKPCICCGRTFEDKSLTGSIWDAGHYRSVGSAPHLRFNEFNVHKQLVICNRHGAGRAVDYRIGLIARMGLQVVELLEGDQLPRKYTIDELAAIKAEYKAKTKALKEAK